MASPLIVIFFSGRAYDDEPFGIQKWLAVASLGKMDLKYDLVCENILLTNNAD